MEAEQIAGGVRGRPGRQGLPSQVLRLIQWEFAYVNWAAQNQLHESEDPALWA